jgi:hypothetical protein
LRWYFRFFVWTRFLWQVSRINFQLVPTQIVQVAAEAAHGGNGPIVHALALRPLRIQLVSFSTADASYCFVKPWQPDPDGSPIRGFQERQESGMLVIPDPALIHCCERLISGVYIVLFRGVNRHPSLGLSLRARRD